MSVLYLVRHGQASFGEEEYDNLSERGLEQAQVLGAALRDRLERVDAVFTGALRRHQQTAERCLSELKDPPASHEHRGLNEYDHDEVLVRLDPRYADKSKLAEDVFASGDPRRGFQELFTRAVARWSSGQHDSEYKESWTHFRQRCVGAVEEIARGLSGSQSAILFTSGGPISAVCQHLLHLADDQAFRLSWALVNCGVTKVLHGSRGLVLSTVNEHAHFEGKHRALITYR